MNRHRALLEERADTFDGVAHHRSADMVGVVMGRKHAGERHVVFMNDAQDVIDGVCRVHHYALARLAVANEIDEIDHLVRKWVARCKIPTAQELSEIQLVVGGRDAHGCRIGDVTVEQLRQGDRVLVGSTLLTIDADFAASLAPGDVVLGVAETGQILRVPARTKTLVSDLLSRSRRAFTELAHVGDEAITEFFAEAVTLLGDDVAMSPVLSANRADVEAAKKRGRSTTRLVLDEKMRRSMIEALEMWREYPSGRNQIESRIENDGFRVESWRAPLGPVGFVFEGRPNVFADATGVLRGGNSVVFRIGSDALGTARALMEHVIEVAIERSGLPRDCVLLVDSAEHAAGWALFADGGLSLAVARGSGESVRLLGAIARQGGVNVSLHGTGGAWLVVGENPDHTRLHQVIVNSLDRKVCNTLNCILLRDDCDEETLKVVVRAVEAAGERRGVGVRFHCTWAPHGFVSDLVTQSEVSVHRAGTDRIERCVTEIPVDGLAVEHEWEVNPEVSIAVYGSIGHAADLINEWSPHFVVSFVGSNAEEEALWKEVDVPFFGDGMTRWVDGQYALGKPELGLSNWESGRLLGRSGVLSGDSVFTVRMRMSQSEIGLSR